MDEPTLEELLERAKHTRGAELAVEHFDIYKDLLFWWDIRLRRWTYNTLKTPNLHTGDFVGYIYQIYVNCWVHLEEERFTNKEAGLHKGFRAYFGAAMHNARSRLIKEWFRNESESWYRYLYMNEDEDGSAMRETNANYAYDEAGYHMYRIPERGAEWTDEVIERMGGPLAAWNFLFHGLPEREDIVLTRRIKHRHSLEEIARDLKVTKERVRQIQDKAGKKLHNRLRADQAFADLFESMPDSEWTPTFLGVQEGRCGNG